MQVITLMSAKGGVGKTTLAANLAHGLHRRGYRTLAVDLDPQNALRLHLGMDAADTSGFIREGLSRNVLFTSPHGVYFAPFGDVQADDLTLFEAFLAENPEWLARSITALEPLGFDYVILDTSPGPNVFLNQALATTSTALMVVLADAASYATVPQAFELIERHAKPNPRYRESFVVINQQPVNGRLGHQVRSALANDREIPLAPVSVHRDSRVGMAMAYQQPVVQYAPSAMVSLDIEYLVDWLVDQTQA